MDTPDYTSDIAIRLWSRVAFTANPDKCWEWQGGTGGERGTGYGKLTIKGVRIHTHRLTWMLVYGTIPDGLWVLHKCDNRKCCNPNHLFLGTHQDNIRDMVNKGRNPIVRGEASGMAKLTQAQVDYIRQRYAQGGTLQREIAAELGLSQTHVSNIIRGRYWKNGRTTAN